MSFSREMLVRITSFLNVAANLSLFFLLTLPILRTGGGPFGFGLLLLWPLIILHLLLIPAIIHFTKKSTDNVITAMNLFAIAGSVFMFVIKITA